ncbi:MAG TPA: sulfotransferase [Steroidobacteraceae bacterium]|nr:sulfotransferase [Steroidobacteraceae bacterium]
MSATSEPVGTLATALEHTQRLLTSEPRLAAEQATEILKVAPGHPLATLLLGVAHRRAGDAAASQSVLEPLAQSQPNWPAAHYELGLTLGARRAGEAAVAALRRAVSLKPEMPDAWRALGDHLTAIGDATGADEAYAQHIKFSTRDPRLMEAAAALCENRIPVAESLLRAHLQQHPTDVPAMRMLAEVAARLNRYADAQVLLERALELAPSFVPARHNYAVVLHRARKPGAALVQVRKLLEADPHNPSYRTLKAALASSLGDYDEALRLYAGVLAEYPHNARVWMSYGHSLKTANRQAECVQTYRKSIELAPHLGEAYWSLANLKTFRFEPADIDAMRAQLARDSLTPEDRFHFHFALGKAFEDAGQFADSFRHYEEGNRLRREAARYDAEWNTEQLRRAKALFTPEFFAARAGHGASAPDPIFIVGLPRSGSTLLEQILSSHPQVEGTMELADIPNIVKELGGSAMRGKSAYPAQIETLDADALRALGERYLEQTRIYRRTDAPFFIDKLPNNFAHTGLIHLILPRAKIIDARRHPLGCCFSGYKQHFARGQHFTYSLDDIGRYYRDYVELMAHYDAVLPGRVHRVFYERMIEDTEGEVRRVLDYCGLPFDERCLRFYENERAVRTASSEQVRRPIYREGVDHWLNYEPWLGPLKSALGAVLEHYPSVPKF